MRSPCRRTSVEAGAQGWQKVSVVVALLAVLDGCGGGEPDPTGGLGQACGPDGTCDEGLTCSDESLCVVGGAIPEGTEGGPCYGNGTCDEGLVCNDEQLCEVAAVTDPCEGIDCAGHGACVGDGSEAECDCDEGYVAEGLDCVEEVSDPCVGIDCGGAGACVVVDGEAACDCDEGYVVEGLSCVEETIDPCEDVDCGDHGACVDVGGSAECDCDEGYIADGLECLEEVDVCDGVDCSGFGSCEVVDGSAECDCDEGYVAEGLSCVEEAANTAPVAADDEAETDQEVAVVIDVLGNDSDPDGDDLTIESFTSAADGAVADNGDGTLTYTPDSGFFGEDEFDYTISDGRGGSDSATVTVTVAEVVIPNRDPVAVDDVVSTEVNVALVVDLLENDSDPDPGDVLVVSGFTQPSSGDVAETGDGTLTYSPDADFAGDDSFTYTISDGEGGTAGATVTVTVTLDEIPPGSIVDLAASYSGVVDTITLSWTAPGDDGDAGQAVGYEVYQSDAPITDLAGLSPIHTIDSALPAGATESHDVPIDWYSGLWHVAVVAVDNGGNLGGLSNELAVNTHPVVVLPPEEIEMGTVALGATASFDVVIANDIASLVDLVVSDLRLEGSETLTLTAGAVDAEPASIAPAASHRATVEFAPTSAERGYGLVRLEHNQSDEPDEHITVVDGHGGNSPPEVLDAILDPVAVGETVEVTAHVRDLDGFGDVTAVTVDLTELGGASDAAMSFTSSVDAVTGEFLLTLDTTDLGTGHTLLVVNAIDASGATAIGRIHLLLFSGTTIDVGPAEAHTTIQAGIDAAAEGDMVLVQPGVWTGLGNKNLTFGGKQIILASAAGPEETVIDAEGVGRAMHFNDSGEDRGTVILGFGLTGGAAAAVRLYAPSPGSPVAPTFLGCRFFENTNGGDGGAVVVEGVGATLRVFESSFEGNGFDAPTAHDGGAIFATSDSAVRIEGVRFEAESAFDGGAIALEGGADAFVRDALFLRNLAFHQGGAVAFSAGSGITLESSEALFNVAMPSFATGGGVLHGEHFPGAVTLTDVVLAANQGWAGGAARLYLHHPERRIEGCRFVGNRSESGGGAIELSSGDVETLSIVGSWFEHNRSGHRSGAILAIGNTNISQSTFFSNSASDEGGAIYASADLVVTWSRFVGNRTTNPTAPEGAHGGAIFSRASAPTSTVVIQRCLFRENRAGDFTDAGGREASGGAVALAKGVVRHSLFLSNQSLNGRGGAVYLAPLDDHHDVEMVLRNLLIAGNHAREGGGVFFARHGYLRWIGELASSTIVDNEATWGGGGLFVEGERVEIADSIIWGNVDALDGADSGDDLYVDVDADAPLTISSTDIDASAERIFDPSLHVNGGEGFLPGPNGNLSADPLFVSGPDDDYYLSHTAAGQAESSPCVDAGSDDASVLGLDESTTLTSEAPDTGVVDLGYHRPTS